MNKTILIGSMGTRKVLWSLFVLLALAATAAYLFRAPLAMAVGARIAAQRAAARRRRRRLLQHALQQHRHLFLAPLLTMPKYSHANNVLWMHASMENIDLRRITLFCQDWGSLIGLRLAAQSPERRERIVRAGCAGATRRRSRCLQRTFPFRPVPRCCAHLPQLCADYTE